MGNIPTTPPTGGGPPNVQGPQPDSGTPVPGQGFKAKPLHWLGMEFSSEEAAKLWQNVIQLVNQEIEKDKQKAVKAIRDFGKDDQGAD
jgi:hypothetical protein